MQANTQRLLQNTLAIIVAGFIFLACSWSTKSTDQSLHNDSEEKHAEPVSATSFHQDAHALERSRYLTLSDAENIIGEPMHLLDTSTVIDAESMNYQCSFMANEMDIKTHKTGAIYFLLQFYNDLPGAQKRYSSMKSSNEDHGIKTITGLGDEAYFHTDGENFYFIMVRKGVNVFNIKVNKITSTTSLEAFNEVARQIASVL